jgi:hypothetical protein
MRQQWGGGAIYPAGHRGSPQVGNLLAHEGKFVAQLDKDSAIDRLSSQKAPDCRQCHINIFRQGPLAGVAIAGDRLFNSLDAILTDSE